MKNFLHTLAIVHITLIAAVAVIYAIGCFLTWQILPIEVNWFLVRFIEVIIIVFSFLTSLDKDL
jgi:drug/metabolite transporter superfamily protein YnfA